MVIGRVYLVGAGPGDPGLLTIKGLDLIRRADVIVYDRLVHPAILKHASPNAELIYAGKKSADHTMKQDEINRLLVEKASEGKTVVRLKGGDPFVFGRGGEEAEALVEAGIPFEVVPGVTSAVAAPAYAGIPVTHRDFCSAVTIATGHRRDDGETEDDRQQTTDCTGRPPSPLVSLRQIRLRRKGEGQGEGESDASDGSDMSDTRVFLMGVENLPNIVSELVKNGRDPSTPVALIRWGTRPEQETLVGTLADIVAKAREADFKSPAVTVVGEVVRLREKLRWFDNRPLFGKRVLVTRSREQASELSELLREQGAEPIEFPVIRISPPESFDELDAALERIENYDWLLFTSANGVWAVVARLLELGRDIRWLKGPKIGAIGPKTAESIACLGIGVDFMPSKFVAESVVEEFPEDPSGKRILIPRAKEAREVIPEKLAERGAQVDVVTAYRTESDASDRSDRIREMLDSGDIDIITFTSSSTVKNFVNLVGASVPEGVKIACIGPITAQTAESLGLKPDIVSEEHTIEGLVQALVAASGPPGD
jgi:uroporphyrinogen III methyltransferase/synthase